MDRYRGLLERYVELYNAGDLDGVMDLYAEDAVQLMPDGTFEGRSAIRDRLAKELAAFADIAHRYVSYVEQGDAFADEWVFVGTHTGPLLLPDGTELAATGKRVEMPGMEFVKVRDGKIVVDNLYYDNLAVAAQFGLLSQPATTQGASTTSLSSPADARRPPAFGQKGHVSDLPSSRTKDRSTRNGLACNSTQHGALTEEETWTIWKSSFV